MNINDALPRELVQIIIGYNYFPLNRLVCKQWFALLPLSDSGHVHICEVAVANGDIAMIEYLSTTLKLGGLSSTNWAAKHGRVDVLEWLQTRYSNSAIAIAPHVWRTAIRNERLNVLEWMYTNYPRLIGSGDTCAFAINTMKLNALKWARSKGLPYPKDAVGYAVVASSLEILQWLINDGCPWSRSNILYIARRYRRDSMIEWIESFA